MKLCRDCKHHQGSWLFGVVPYVPGFWYSFAKCDAVLSPVSGKAEWFCETHRSSRSEDMCGREAKLFEPKE